ncbi:MAG: hypothetical protein AAFX99_27045 [Myxococcota bacterium]
MNNDLEPELNTLAQQFLQLRKGYTAGRAVGDRDIASRSNRDMDRILDRALVLLRKRRRRRKGFWKGLFYRPPRRLLLNDWRKVLARNRS